MAATFSNILEKLHLSGGEAEGVPLKEPTDQELDELKTSYAEADQEHVFTFYDDLTASEKAGLYANLRSIDPKNINTITQRTLGSAQDVSKKEPAHLEPLPDTATASLLDSKDDDMQSWYTAGLEFVANGEVAVVLMAGGQGTRLGSSAPKGCFDIGLPSGKSLFQIQAERIWKVQQLAEKEAGKKDIVIPWYIMTSGPTRQPTEQFFEEHKYFGLCKDDVIIFEQGVLPCISNEGKILLEDKSKVGHFGLFLSTPYTYLLRELGCRCTRWKWRHLPSTSDVQCADRHAQARNTAHTCILCRQLFSQSCGPSLHWFFSIKRCGYRYEGCSETSRKRACWSDTSEEWQT